jgi:uncharacterized Zn finger protein
MVKRKSTQRHDYDYDHDYFPPARPIKPKEGIQSRSQRGAFASNWWAKRWLSVLESYGIGSRLQRGRSYARGGQVVSIDVQPGVVNAKVQGSRPKPYAVTVEVKSLSDAEWERVLDAISGQAIFAAQLLEGTMPQEIESTFKLAQVSLFPNDPRDVLTDCSCPDYANPCKHVAAVYYLLGEQFDLDPFLIFTLRGRTRDQIIEALRARRTAAVQEADVDEVSPQATAAALPLDAEMSHYWGGDMPDWTFPQIAAPAVNSAVLRRLGAPPGDLKKPLEALYQSMTMHVQAQVSGGDEVPPQDA